MGNQRDLDTEAWVYRQWPKRRPRFEIGLRFALVSGLVRFTGFQVLDKEAKEPFLNASAIRKLPIAAMIREELLFPGEELSRLAGLSRSYAFGDLSEFGLGLESRPKPKGKQTASRGRPRKYFREHYEHVASIYRANPGAPTTAVAREFQVNRTTAANWVRKARQLNLLELPESQTSGRES